MTGNSLTCRTEATVQKIKALSNKTFQTVSSISDIDHKNKDLIFVAGEDKGHNAWTKVYNNVNFYKWLLRFQKN